MIRKRQANIEFARVIACFMVICLHTVTWYTTEDGLLENSLFIRCFMTDGVPLFWYIMGLFLFSKSDVPFPKRLKKAFTTLLLPAFAVMVFSQIWQDWILSDIGQVSFFSCLDLHSFDFHNLFGNILRWSSDMTFGGHFWYIFSYFQVILWVPLLSFVCVNEHRANRVRHYLMLLSVLYIINRDISHIFVLTINGNTYPLTIYSIITPTLLYVLLGYETSLHYNQIARHASLLKWCGLSGFVIFNLLKYYLTVTAMRINIRDSYFLGISTVCGYLASYSLFLFAYCTTFKIDSIWERLALHFGSKTLGIYLIHGCVFRKLKAIGIRDSIYTWYLNDPNNLFKEIVCTIIYAAIVLAVCYLIVLLFGWLRLLFIKCIQSIRLQRGILSQQ